MSAALQAERYVEAAILTSAGQCLRDKLAMLGEDVVRKQQGGAGRV